MSFIILSLCPQLPDVGAILCVSTLLMRVDGNSGGMKLRKLSVAGGWGIPTDEIWSSAGSTCIRSRGEGDQEELEREECTLGEENGSCRPELLPPLHPKRRDTHARTSDSDVGLRRSRGVLRYGAIETLRVG